MIDERLDRIAAPLDDRDLIAWLEIELERRQLEVQVAVGREMAARSLLLECRRVTAGLPAGQTLTVSTFMPNGLSPLDRATRQHLLSVFIGEDNTTMVRDKREEP